MWVCFDGIYDNYDVVVVVDVFAVAAAAVDDVAVRRLLCHNKTKDGFVITMYTNSYTHAYTPTHMPTFHNMSRMFS